MERINPEFLLGLCNLPNDKEEGEDIYSYVVITGGTEKHDLRLAQPCIANTKKLRTNEVVSVTFPFPQKEGYWPRDRTNVRRSNLKRVDIADPFSRYRLHTIRRFTQKSVDLIITVAKTHGITSSFLSQKAGNVFLEKIEWFTKRFKYHTVYASQRRDYRGSLSVVNDVVQPIITAFDLQLCIPVLNSKKCDGIGLNYELILAKSTQKKKALVSFGCLSMLFSNFRDNLFYLDGVRVLDENPIRKETVDAFRKSTNIKAGQGEEKAKEKKEKHEHIMFYDSISTSTTTGRYYKYKF